MRPVFLLLLTLLLMVGVIIVGAQEPAALLTAEINGQVEGLRWQADGSAFWWWARRIETDYNDFELWRWEINNSAPRPILDYHVDQVELYLDWQAGAERVLVWGGPTFEVWDAVGGREILTFAAGDTVWGAAWHADYNQALFWTLSGEVYLADVNSGQTTHLLSTGSDLRAAVWLAEGSARLAGVQDDALVVWDLQGQLHAVQMPATIHGVSWDASGTRLLVITADFMQLLDADSGAALRTLSGGRGIYKPQWSPDRTRILALNEQEPAAEMWDALSGELLFLIPPPEGKAIQLIGGAWSPDGRQAAVFGPWSMLSVWDAHSGTRLFALKDAHLLPPLAWSPDQSRLVYLGDDGRIRILDAQTGLAQTPLYAQDIPIVSMVGAGRAMQWSVDGSRMLVYGDSSAAWIWDTGSGQRLATLRATPTQDSRAWLYRARWSPDETRIVTASGPDYCDPINCPNQIQVWPAP